MPELILIDAVFFLEFADTSAGLDNSLGTGIKRMTLRADLNFDLFLSRFGLESIAANASYGRLFIIRMDPFFHFSFLLFSILPDYIQVQNPLPIDYIIPLIRLQEKFFRSNYFLH